jgi:hypothetical protein
MRWHARFAKYWMASEVRGHDSPHPMPMSTPRFLIEPVNVNLDEHSGWTHFGLEPGSYGVWRIRAAVWHVCDHGAPHCRSRGASGL